MRVPRACVDLYEMITKINRSLALIFEELQRLNARVERLEAEVFAGRRLAEAGEDVASLLRTLRDVAMKLRGYSRAFKGRVFVGFRKVNGKTYYVFNVVKTGRRLNNATYFVAYYMDVETLKVYRSGFYVPKDDVPNPAIVIKNGQEIDYSQVPVKALKQHIAVLLKEAKRLGLYGTA